MKKSIFFSLFYLVLVSTTVQSEVYLPRHINNVKAIHANYSKQKPFMFFDIHDVLVKTKTAGGIRSFLKSKGKGKIIKTGLKSLFKKKKRKKNGTKQKAKDIFYNELEKARIKGKTKKYNALANFLNDVYKPMPGIEGVLSRLKNSGCRLHLLSNISPSALRELPKKPSMRNTFNFFDLNNINSNYAPGHEWTFKPEAEAYTLTLDKFNLKPSNSIVFVDDKIGNVRRATTCGFVGIHFTSVEQLTQDLQRLGLI